MDSIVQEVWGSSSCEWEWILSECASRGLIAIWNDNDLKLDDVIKSQRVLITKFSTIQNNSFGQFQVFTVLMKSLIEEIFGIIFLP